MTPYAAAACPIRVGSEAEKQYNTHSNKVLRDEAPARGNAAEAQESFVRLNAGVRVFPTGGPWEFALIGRNLTNEFYLVTASDKPGDTPAKGQTSGVIGRTREVIAQFTYRF